MGTRVDPAALRRAAQASDQIAAALQRAAALLGPETAAAARALPGFRTRQTLETLQWAWKDALARHHTYLDLIGNALRQGATGYRQADDESAHRFRSLDRS